MRYYSEITKKLYNTAEEALEDEDKAIRAQQEAEAKAEALRVERANRSQEIEKAFDDMCLAKKHFRELVEKFNKDYKCAWTISRKTNSFDDLFDRFI